MSPYDAANEAGLNNLDPTGFLPSATDLRHFAEQENQKTAAQSQADALRTLSTLGYDGKSNQYNLIKQMFIEESIDELLNEP